MKEDITKQLFTKFQGSVPTRRGEKITELFLTPAELFLPLFGINKSYIFCSTICGSKTVLLWEHLSQ